MADALQIKDPDTLQLWLDDKPADWARLIAIRAALRVFPVALQGGNAAAAVGLAGFQGMALSVWRCLLISSVAIKNPTDEIKNAASAVSASGVGGGAHAASAFAASAAVAAASAAATSEHASYAAAAALAAAYDAAARGGAYYAASLFVGADSARKSLGCDCTILDRDGPEGLKTAPLWLVYDDADDREREPKPLIATPSWAHQLAVRLPDELSALLGPNAALIADWYLPLLNGSVNNAWSRLFLGNRARKLALQKDEFWKVTDERSGEMIMEDIAAALGWRTATIVGPDDYQPSFNIAPNAVEPMADFIVRFVERGLLPVSIDDIRAQFQKRSYAYVDSTLRRELGNLARTGRITRLRRGLYTGSNYIGEIQGAITEPPLPVEQGSGPKFGASSGRLDRFPAPPLAGEEADPTLAKFHARIKKRLNSLRQAFRNDLARFPQLAETLYDYEDAIRPERIGDLDIDELWMSGAGLIAQARAFAALNPSTQVTEPLEPQQQALLGEIARLHGALIMGFAKGRELAEKSGLPLLTPEEFRALLEHERTIVRWLLETDRYDLSDQARGFLESVDHTLLSASEGAEQLAILGYPTVRNLLIFSANALGSVERLAGRLSLAGVPVNLAVTGMLYFFKDNLGPILAFASSIPELRSYLEYHLVRLEIDWQDRNAGNDDDWKT